MTQSHSLIEEYCADAKVTSGSLSRHYWTMLVSVPLPIALIGLWIFHLAGASVRPDYFDLITNARRRIKAGHSPHDSPHRCSHYHHADAPGNTTLWQHFASGRCPFDPADNDGLDSGSAHRGSTVFPYSGRWIRPMLAPSAHSPSA